MARKVIPIALALTVFSSVVAHAGDPDLAPGRDPSGMAIAVLGDGVDYQRADVAAVLARDGEGEAIAWDAADGDPRPFARDGSGTDVVLAATARGGVRVVAVRFARGNAASLAQGIVFATGTPARIMLAMLDDKERAELTVMTAAAKRFEASLFVASVPGPTAEEKKSEALANLVLIDSADDRLAAAKAIARTLGCGRGGLTGDTGEELRRAFLGRLDEKSTPGCQPESGNKRE